MNSSNERRLSDSTKPTIPGPPVSEEILSLNDWVMFEVESDQIRLIGKILEGTIVIIRVSRDGIPSRRRWTVTVMYVNHAKRCDLADIHRLALEMNTPHLSQVWTYYRVVRDFPG